jgi:type I restriction enzyme S subunit
MREGWELKKLNQIGKVFNGNSINEKVKKDKYTDVEDGLPFIATKDVGFDSSIDYQNGVRIPFNETNQFKIAPSNTPLICAEGGSAGRKISFTNQDVCFGNKLFAFAPNKNVDSKYVFYYYFSSSFQKHFTTELAGIIGGVSMNKFKDIEIPLPPLPEQQRIVAILDEAFAAIAKAKANAEQNLRNAKELFESYLQGVFENKGEGWEEKKLGEVCETGSGGTPLKTHKDYYEHGTIPWLLSGEVSQGEIFQSKNYITEKGLKNSSAKLFPPNTVLVAMYGATAGQVGILRFEASTNQAVCGILPNNKTLPEFIYYCFLSKKDELVAQAVGGAQPNISQIKVKNTIIPLPTLTEQQTIVRQLDALRAETQRLEGVYQQKLADLEELKKSILQKAFAGELTANSISS